MQYITRFVAKGISRRRVAVLVRVGLAIGSFVIYAIAALTIIDHRVANPVVMTGQRLHVQFETERTSLAAAVSNVVYRAPIGTIDTGALALFGDFSKPTRQTLDETRWGEVRTGSLLQAAADGNGIGYPVIASLAMRLFGLHLSSLIFALISLMAISTLVFLIRYRDDRLFAVPLYFSSLTIMLFTPLATDPFTATQIPVGGIRYFSLVGILPAMHIFWEIGDPSRFNSKTAIRNLILLGIQVLVVAVVIVVRGSAAYLPGALAAAFLLTLGAYRRNPAGLRDLLRKGALMAALGAVFVGSFYLWVPEAYKESGRTMGVFWHRVLISLGANPAWPFGNLREAYSSCAPYAPQRFNTPQSLVPGIVDWNGRCIWWVYALEHGLTPGETLEEIDGGRYEMVMKQTFLEIAREYPKEVWETFVYYKPMLIFRSLRRLLNFYLPGKTLGIQSLLLALLLAQAGTLAAFIGSGMPGSSEDRTRLLAGALLLFSVCSLGPLLVAWSNLHTSADLLFYFFAGLGLALAVVIKRIPQFFRRPDPETPKQDSHCS